MLYTVGEVAARNGASFHGIILYFRFRDKENAGAPGLYRQMKLIRNLFVASSLITSILSVAQTVRTDTVQPGYYIPLDTNVVSCKVAITPNGKNVQFINTTTNHLPDSVISKIENLTAGSVVVYTEVTVLRKGVLEKAPVVRYVIGARNSVPALREPALLDSLTAPEISTLVFDRYVISFEVSFLIDGAFYTYQLTGNGICCEPRERIITLQPGTKVWVDNMKRKNDDGSISIVPSRVYVVK